MMLHSPDGRIHITVQQLDMALVIYSGLDWTAEPLAGYAGTLDGEASAMAGILGAMLGLSADGTQVLFATSQDFQDLVLVQLHTFGQLRKSVKAALS